MSRYHTLSIAEKRAEALARVRAPSVTCPKCDTQVMPADLPKHMKQRCPGLRDPVPGDQWLTAGEVRAMGVKKQTLSDWVASGKVRYRGDRGDRVYLLRDLVLQDARPHGNRRR